MGQALTADLPRYDIDLNRAAYFIGQTAEETEAYRFFVEQGGPHYFSHYDGRRDLGNIHPGDGYKYRGRGAFMLTGYANYNTMGARIGVDLLNNPDKAADPALAILISCIYWSDHKMNQYADQHDILRITKIINGGTNGLSMREGYTNAFLSLLS